MTQLGPSGLISQLEELCQTRPDEAYDWTLFGKVVQKTNLHKWEKNGQSGTHFILIVRDLDGKEIKLTMFQFTPAHWDAILEDHCYQIANPSAPVSAAARSPGRALGHNPGNNRARIARLQFTNRLFNRLPTLCELIVDYNPRIPYDIHTIFRENPRVQVPGSLNYQFMPELSAYEREGFNAVRDVCAVIWSIDASEHDAGGSVCEFSMHETHPGDRVFVLTLMLCDMSAAQLALILYSKDLQTIAKLYPEDFVFRIGDTISIKDAIYRETQGRYRRALKLKHSYGSYVILGDREAFEVEGYLPRESAEGLRRKAALADWWANGGASMRFRNLSIPVEVCSIREFIAQPPRFDSVSQTLLGTLEVADPRDPNGIKLADETGQVIVRLSNKAQAGLFGLPVDQVGEGIGAQAAFAACPARYSFQQFKVMCSRTKQLVDSERQLPPEAPRGVSADVIEEVDFAAAVFYYAGLIEQM